MIIRKHSVVTICLIAITIFSLHSCTYLSEKKSKETFGAEANPTGDPIGGGKGYRNIVTKHTYLVKTSKELLTTLKKAKAGEVIYVDNTVEIDLSGNKNIEIPGGVTLASGRGVKDGALIYTNDLDAIPLFLTGGEKVRITGLRLRGPDPERRTDQMRQLGKEGKYYSIPNSRGIQSSHPYLEVDNCELWGWSHAAVYLHGAKKAYIHHNYIHHNQRSGLGYGVSHNKADSLIEANLFDWCRHHIAATGNPEDSYEARYNLVLDNGNGHSFDVHGGRDRKDGTDIAGDVINIHHNTFRATIVSAFVIRGKPAEKAELHHNWFLHTDPAKAIRQTNAQGNLHVYSNQYGPNRTLKE